MKLILALIFSFNLHCYVAQNDTTQIRKNLIGTWKVFSRGTHSLDTLDLKKVNDDPHPYGNIVIFKEDQLFEDSYWAECGNDTNIHQTQGKWSYNSESKILYTTIPIYYHTSKKYKIIYMDQSEMVLISQ
jgi:hypothetical protein